MGAGAGERDVAMITARPGREGGRAVGRRDREKPPDAVRLTRDASGASAATSPPDAVDHQLGQRKFPSVLAAKMACACPAEAAPLQYVRARMHRIAWDDLRYVLAVAEAGSLAAAARTLGVSHTTVLRGWADSRLGWGCGCSSAYRRATRSRPGARSWSLRRGRSTESSRRSSGSWPGQDLRLVGTLPPGRPRTRSWPRSCRQCWRRSGPSTRVSGSRSPGSNPMANVTKRDADAAIRPAKEPPETLVGRRVAGVEFAVYGAQGYLAGRDEVGDLAGQIWVGPDDSLAGTSVARWMRSALPGARVAVRADPSWRCARARPRGWAQSRACYPGDTSDGLRRIWPLGPGACDRASVLTHEDLRRTARVRAFTEFAADALAARRDLLEGRRP